MLIDPYGEVCLAQRRPALLHCLVSFGQWLTSFSSVLAKASFQIIIFRLAHSYRTTPPLGLCVPLVCKDFRDQKPGRKCQLKPDNHDVKIAMSEAGAKSTYNAS